VFESAFGFTIFCFISLYLITKFQLTREQNKFTKKFSGLPQAKIELAKTQRINKEIIVNTPNFNF
jgi:heme exporter protein D